MWIIASIEFHTGKGEDFGQTWTLGHLDISQKEHLVIAKTLDLKTIYTLLKPLVQKT